MSTRLPPLQTLLAFEAAARHQSYTRAAEELSLTHGAISHQIASLEQRLSTTLFVREKRRMMLTEDGRLLLARVRQALNLLERAFERGGPERRTTLTLSILPSLAHRWLAPRLPAFELAHPDIDLALQPTQLPVDLQNGSADCAIRYGPGGWPEMQQEKLMSDELFAVCSPGYRGGRLPQSPEELADCTLLRNPWQPWEPWLHAAGLGLREPQRGASFTDSALLLDAAAAGLGVALARRVLAEEDLRNGRLVKLFDIAIPDTSAYYLLWRSDAAQLAVILRLRAWLVAQAQAQARAG